MPPSRSTFVAVPGDELDEYVAEALEDPAFRDAYDDAGARTALVAALAQRREQLGWSIAAVADRMKVAHGTVAAIERGGTDPRLSLLQMYARAVGLRLTVAVEADPGRGAHLAD
jgi:HTH-type transcriptional regulator/antitoxin HipB